MVVLLVLVVSLAVSLGSPRRFFSGAERHVERLAAMLTFFGDGKNLFPAERTSRGCLLLWPLLRAGCLAPGAGLCLGNLFAGGRIDFFQVIDRFGGSHDVKGLGAMGTLNFSPDVLLGNAELPLTLWTGLDKCHDCSPLR
jgi:hypothetical protein